MRVLIDAKPMMTFPLGGVGAYCQHLIQALYEMQVDGIVPVYNKSGDLPYPYPYYQVQKIRFPYRNLRSNRLTIKLSKIIPLEWFVGDFDIFHGTDYRHLPTSHAKKIITVHDLAGFHFPQFLSDKNLRFQLEEIPEYIRTSDHIIAVSESTKKDIIQFTGFDSDKITVIPLAADADMRVMNQSSDTVLLEQVRCKYDLPDSFFLYVGSYDERKNLENIIAGLAYAQKNGVTWPLLLVGAGSPERKEALEQLIRQHGLTQAVRFIGHVPREELPCFYNLASVFLHPSWLEGFGLPALEAMQCGTPVIAANTFSLPEVVQDGGILVNPSAPEEIGQAMLQLAEDSALRIRLSQAALTCAEQFSWRKMAEQTLQVYKHVIGVGK